MRWEGLILWIDRAEFFLERGAAGAAGREREWETKVRPFWDRWYARETFFTIFLERDFLGQDGRIRRCLRDTYRSDLIIIMGSKRRPNSGKNLVS